MARKEPPLPPTAVVKAGSATTIDLSGAVTTQQAVFKAMLIYLDTPGLALRELWRTRRLGDDDTAPFFRDVINWHALERAALKQRWAKRRQEHWAIVERRVLAALQTTHVERELKELAQLEAVESVVLSHIHGVTDEHGKVKVAAAKPKSLEGAVGAIVNLGKYRDAKRARVEADIASRATQPEDDPMTGAPITVATVEDELSEEEIEAMAQIVASRRAGLIEEKKDGDDGAE